MTLTTPGGFPFFIVEQFSKLPPVIPKDLTGRVVIITGASSGLGLDCAKHMSKMNPKRLILAVRNVDKMKELAKTGFAPTPIPEIWELDLESFESVRAFSKCVNEDCDRLDIVIESAGINTEKWDVTVDGYERTLQTNVLSTGLLALLLLPLLNRTRTLPIANSTYLDPHLVIVGSEVHYWAKFAERNEATPLAALNDKSKHAASDRYMTSKLLLLFVVRQLTRLTVSNGVVVNYVNPGLCITNLGYEEFKDRRAIMFLVKLFARTSEEGSRTLVWAALNWTSPAAYLTFNIAVPPSIYSRSEEGYATQERLWREECAIWKKVAPEVNQVLDY